MKAFWRLFERAGRYWASRRYIAAPVDQNRKTRMPLSDLTPACIALLTAGSAGDEPEVAEVAEDSVKDLRKTCRICSQYFDTLAA